MDAMVEVVMKAGAPYVPKTKSVLLAAGKAVDVATLVGHLRASYPVLQATTMNSALRLLLLLELVA